jgi:hypothetical protein
MSANAASSGSIVGSASPIPSSTPGGPPTSGAFRLAPPSAPLPSAHPHRHRVPWAHRLRERSPSRCWPAPPAMGASSSSPSSQSRMWRDASSTASATPPVGRRSPRRGRRATAPLATTGPTAKGVTPRATGDRRPSTARLRHARSDPSASSAASLNGGWDPSPHGAGRRRCGGGKDRMVVSSTSTPVQPGVRHRPAATRPAG